MYRLHMKQEFLFWLGPSPQAGHAAVDTPNLWKSKSFLIPSRNEEGKGRMDRSRRDTGTGLSEQWKDAWQWLSSTASLNHPCFRPVLAHHLKSPLSFSTTRKTRLAVLSQKSNSPFPKTLHFPSLLYTPVPKHKLTQSTRGWAQVNGKPLSPGQGQPSTASKTKGLFLLNASL